MKPKETKTQNRPETKHENRRRDGYLIDTYLSALKDEAKLSDSTIASHKGYLRMFSLYCINKITPDYERTDYADFFNNDALLSIDKPFVEGYKNYLLYEQRATKRSVCTILSAIRRFYDWLAERQLIAHNPFTNKPRSKLIDDYTHYLKSERKFCQGTIGSCRSYIKKFAIWCDKISENSKPVDEKLLSVETHQIEAYIQKLKTEGIEKRIITDRISSVRRFYDWLAERQVIIHNPAGLSRRDITNGTHSQLIKDYLSQLKSRLSESTIAGYRCHLTKFIDFCRNTFDASNQKQLDSLLLAVDTQTGEAYIKKAKTEGKKFYEITATVRRFYNWLLKRGLIERNPILGLWSLNLKEPRTSWIDPFVIYFNRLLATPLLSEKQACSLWMKALGGNSEASRTLAERLTPLVTHVIRDDLHDNVEINRYNSELLTELIAQGSYLIVEQMGNWDCKESLIGFLRAMLIKELREAKHNYHKGLHSWQISLDEQMNKNDLRDTSRKNVLASREVSIEENFALRNELISEQSKGKLSASLRGLFTRHKLLQVFENGSSQKWVVFIIHSLSRLGEAKKGDCDLNLVILTELEDNLAKEAIKTLSQSLEVDLRDDHTNLPIILIGKNGNYHKALQKANGNILGRFLSILHKFDIGSPEKGFATIETVSVNGHKRGCHPTLGTSHIRALRHISEDTFSYKAGSNAFLVAESYKDTHQTLINELIKKVRTCSSKETVQNMLDAERYYQENNKLGHNQHCLP